MLFRVSDPVPVVGQVEELARAVGCARLLRDQQDHYQAVQSSEGQ